LTFKHKKSGGQIVKKAIMKQECTIKQDHIIEAAIKRFAHFGANKTTMTEIAEDLGITKQSLFYYFSDKQSLTAAVEEKITSAYFESVEKHFANAPDVEQALLKLIGIKKSFYERYFMLLIQAESLDGINGNSVVAEAKQRVKNKEIQLVAGLLEKGVAQKILKPLDTIKVAGLLLEILSAFEHCVVLKRAIPDQKSFNELSKKQKEVLELIINGLKCDAWKS
jgi:TetR/AcrR family transcriptional regulator